MNQTFAELIKHRPRQPRGKLGLNLLYLIDILERTKECRRATMLYRTGRLKLRAAHYKYLNWCIERDLIKKTVDGKAVFLVITDKGRALLEVIS